ncbi:MAG: hypothetical protein CVU91_07840 [Firmicutes bacterium HGW-Firmicutes-16]|nr:MAG: hypothetical protein CVU91_07840 [Firmicutes bacterium HGW-Firmicutes-16]
MDSINIVYFSGTGGTEKAAKGFESSFKEAGFSVALFRMKEIPEDYAFEKASLLLLYPVYALNAPQKVHEWIKCLDRVSCVQTAVVTISGGGEICPNTASRVSVIKKLEKKGFIVTYEQMLVMPSNFGVTAGEVLSRLLLEVLPKKVQTITNDIAIGISRRTKPLIIDRLISLIARIEHIGAHRFGKNIKVSDACTGCGWCCEHCPSGNIAMENGKPVFGNGCNFCLGCIYGCPCKALDAGMGKSLVFKDGFDLKRLEKIPPLEDADIEALAKGYAWSGVKKYLID